MKFLPIMRVIVVSCLLVCAEVAQFSEPAIAQNDPNSVELEWSADNLAKQVEYATGVRFPFDTLCNAHLLSEPSFPIGCRFGPIDVYIQGVELNGLRALPSLMMFDTNNNWLHTNSESEANAAARVFDWGFVPLKLWQASGVKSGAICGYRDPAVVLESDEIPRARAATCFLGFPTSEGQEILVRIEFEATRELDSVFANNASYEVPFLSYITFFVHSTYSLGGF